MASAANALDVKDPVASEFLLRSAAARQYFEQAGDAICVVDAAGTLSYANPAWLSMMRLLEGPGAVMERSHPAREEVLWALGRARRGEEVRDSEMRFTGPDGDAAWLSVSAYPIRDSQEHIAGAFCVCRDITHTRTLEEQREIQRRFLDSILQHAPFGVILLSAPDFRVLAYNDAVFVTTTGGTVERAELEGVILHDLVDETTAAAVEDLIRRAVRVGTSLTVPEFITLNGAASSARSYRGTVAPLTNPSGEIDQILVCFTETTDRLRSNTEIQRLIEASEARAEELETIINSMGDAVVITDEKSGATRWNPAYIQLLGIPEQGETSMDRISKFNVRDWNGQPVVPQTMTALRAVREGGEASSEYIITTPTGADVYLRVQAFPLRDASGSVRGAVIVLRDVTALRAADRQKDEFLSLVSHELRTPVTIIGGFTQVLRRSVESADARDTQRRLVIIERQVRQLTALINDLLDLSRVDHASFECALAPLDYSALARAVVDEMQQLNPDRHFELAIVDGLSVQGDAARLRQVLANLLDNAVKHGPPNSQVHVAVESSEEMVTTYVRDAGPPLPSEERQRVFNRFYRVSPGPIRNGGSLGLGLYICRSIVQSHGGHIWVADEDRCSFAFSLQPTPVGSS